MPWEKATAALENALRGKKLEVRIDPGEGVFYGPKIDVQIKSAIGREFTLATNQVDFAQPINCDLKFINKEGKEERPLIIHRAPLSTHERLIGFLLEHYAGAFPMWLAPVQVKIIPVADRHLEHANKVGAAIKGHGIRAEVDDRSE